MASKEQFETMVVRPKILIKYENVDYNILSTEDESALDVAIKNINDFMANNDASGKSDEVKDKVYGDVQVLWHTFKNTLDSVKFNFFLDREQFKYLTDLLLLKFEYDVNAIFYGLELTDVLGSMKEKGTYTNTNKYISYGLTATEVTYLYHLLSQHKIKGLGKAAFTFANIIRRIGEISKIFDYYNNVTKDMSKDITDWIASFDPIEEEVAKATNSKGKKKVEKLA